MTKHNIDANRQAMATQSIGRLLMQYALPTMLAMSVSALFNIFDSFFLCRSLGTPALAALAVTLPFMNIITAIGAVVNVGATTNMAISVGRNESARALKIFANAFFMNMLLAVVFIALSLWQLEPLLRLFGASSATMPLAKEYMAIIIAGTFFTFSVQGMTGALRAIGSPKTAMYMQLQAVFINFVLDPIFIFVFDWGMSGAALATLFSQILCWMVLIMKLFSSDLFMSVRQRTLRIDFHILRDILSIGVSPLLSGLFGCVVAVFVNRALIVYGGDNTDVALGAYTIVQRFTQLLVMLVAGMGVGMQTIVSQNIAQQLYDRVRRILMWSIFFAMCVMTVGYTIVLLFAEPLYRLFTSDHLMIDIGVPALHIGLCTFPFVGGQMIAVAFFQSIRLPKASMIISLTRMLFFLLPLLVWLPSVIGLNGVWWAMALADMASVTITWLVLWFQTKKLSIGWEMKA